MRRWSRRQLLGQFGTATAGAVLASVGVGGSAEEPTPVSTLGTDADAVEWHHTYGNGEYQCKAVVDTPDGPLLVGRTGSGRGAAAWLAVVAPDGSPRWTTTIDTPGFTIAADAVDDGDGYTVLVTTDESPGIRLVSLDRAGTVTDRRRLDGPAEMTGRAARLDFATNDVTNHAQALASVSSGYLLGGYLGSNRRPGDATDAWVRAVDADGTLRWERRYDASGVGAIEQPGGTVVLTGVAGEDAWLQGIDSEGTRRWRHTYGGAGSESASAAVSDGRGILYGGRTGSAADRHSTAMLVRTTTDGEFVWRRTLTPGSVVDLQPFGSGVAVTGEPEGSGSGRDPEKPVSLVDRWGRVRGTATVSVDPGAPVGLATFDDGVAVGGWDRRGGVWLAKVDVDALV